MVVLHKNDNKHDNRLENLYYANKGGAPATQPVGPSGIVGLVLPKGKNNFYMIKRKIGSDSIKASFSIKQHGDDASAKTSALVVLRTFVEEKGNA